MKKVFSLLITLAMLISTAVVPMSASADASVWDGTTDSSWTTTGTGAEDDPYEISSAAQLADLANKAFYAVSTSTDVPVAASENTNVYNSYTGKYFKLTNDIDLNEKEWLPIGRHGMRFNGIFDGNNHVVKNLKITTNYFGMGLFGATGSSVVIKNLGIEKADMTFASKGYNGGVFDYNAADSRTETTDKTWTTANLYKTDRTNGAGTLAGIVEGGTISNCFVRNTKIIISGSNIPGSGGLLGFSVTTKEQTGSGVGAYTITVNNTYVYDVELGGNSWFPSSFVGSLKDNDSGYLYYSNLTATNCYAAKVNITHYLTAANTFVENRGTTWTPVNCYAADITGYTRDASLAVTDKAAIVSGIAALDGWSADNASAPINGGYPVLAWENTWSWDGKKLDSSWTATGDGSESDPYEISSGAQLADLANKAFYAVSTSTDVPVAVSETDSVYNSYTGKHFKLMADIDLGENEWLPIGRHGMRFNGVFDGNNHVVKNLNMTTNYFGMGLFGATGSSVVIKNLGIENANITFASKGYNGGVFDYNAADSRTETTDKTWTTANLYKTDRTNGAGTLIGIFAGGTISNCYVKDTIVKNNGTSSMFIGGLLGSASGTIASGDRATITITNSYVNGAELGGVVWDVSAFVGTVTNANNNYGPTLNLTATNCYVTDFELIDGTSSGTAVRSVFTIAGYHTNSTTTTTNCYSDSVYASGYNENEEGKKAPHATVADKATIEKTLVTGDKTFCLDSVTAPVNGGYPVLGWEKTWKVDTDPQSFYKVTGYADGKVTLIQSDSTVTGKVIVAVYDGTRFVNAVTATAANGEITVEGLTVGDGNTIKVFVWDSMTGLTPLSTVYSPTV